jgi:hypothetical protein
MCDGLTRAPWRMEDFIVSRPACRSSMTLRRKKATHRRRCPAHSAYLRQPTSANGTPAPALPPHSRVDCGYSLSQGKSNDRSTGHASKISASPFSERDEPKCPVILPRAPWLRKVEQPPAAVRRLKHVYPRSSARRITGGVVMAEGSPGGTPGDGRKKPIPDQWWR